jgi:hypothetical protein
VLGQQADRRLRPHRQRGTGRAAVHASQDASRSSSIQAIGASGPARSRVALISDLHAGLGYVTPARGHELVARSSRPTPT